ncbi:MAG TPA: hypothetical protein VNY73_06400, partial [Bacteroidia bacterium]|nr:hypothetical protein [Bacteroidia bacterium]
MKKNTFFMFLCLLVFSFVNEKALKAQCPVTITPAAPYVCSGQTATLTAVGGTAWNWSANAGSATTQTVAVTPTVNTVYTVTAATGTCVATHTVLVSVITNTVIISPPVGTTTLYCTGIPYQFGAVDTTSGGYTVQYYNWHATPLAGVSIANGACPTCNGPDITFATTGNYTLSVIVNLSSGCLDSAKYAVSVVQTPTVSTSPFAPQVCVGGTGTMIYATGAGAAGTYSWTPMINVATMYAAGDSILINPANPGVYTYSVVGTNAAGCSSAPTIVTATVNLPPVIHAYAADDSICSYLNTSVAMVPSYIVPGTTYTWTSAPNANLGSPLSYSTAVSPIYSGNVDTTFSYYGNIKVPGCPAFPTYTVHVVVVPTPTVDMVSDTVQNCNKMGDSLKVTSNPSHGVHFSWWPHTALSDTTGAGVFANPHSTQNITQTYYVTPRITVGNNVCVGKRDSVKVLIGDTTYATITPRYWIVCKGMVDTLVAGPALTQLNNTYQYYWTIPSVSSGTVSVTSDSLFITPNALGVYTLTVKGTCVKKHTEQILIAVNNCAMPVPTFTMTADTICRRHCITFSDLTQNYT